MTNEVFQMPHIRPGRYLTAILAVGGLLGLIICIAVVLGFNTSDFQLARTSVAAPAESYDITSSFEIGPDTGIRIDSGTIELANPAGSRAASAAPVTLPEDGSGSLIIDGGVFQLAGGETDEDVDPVMYTAPLVDAVRNLKFEKLAIRRGTVQIKLPSGQTETLTNVTADLTARRRTSLSLRGTGTFRGQEVSFDVSGPSLLDSKAGASRALKAVVKSPLLQISFDGRLVATDELRLQGQANVAVTSLREVARWLGAAWPSGSGLKEMSIAGEVDWQAQALAFDKATFQLDGNAATGTLALAFGGSRPNLTGTLAFKTLDLTAYLAQELKGQFASLLPWFSTLDEQPLPIGGQLDADLRISASQVLLPGMELGRFAASVSLKSGRLLADIAEIGIETGQGSGQVTANLLDSPPQISVRGKLDGIDAGRASTLLLGHSTALQGMSTITIDLTTRGNTAAELVSKLRGKAAVSLREGGRLGIDMKSLMGAAQKSKLEGWEVATRGQTTVDGLEAKLRVDRGVVASELVEAVSGESRLKALGTISLVSRQIDIRVVQDVSPAAAGRAQAPAVPQDILVVRGPWSAPTIQLER
ncbi:AsmA family protein [Leptospira interrogans]